MSPLLSNVAVLLALSTANSAQDGTNQYAGSVTVPTAQTGVAPSKQLPTPQAPSKVLPVPQAPSKTAPAAQAPTVPPVAPGAAPPPTPKPNGIKDDAKP
jgi:hypothetical protein